MRLALAASAAVALSAFAATLPQGASGQSAPPCGVTFDDGTSYDFSPLQSNSDLTFTDPASNDEFYFHMCGDAVKSCIGGQLSVGMGIYDPANGGPEDCTVLGTWDSDVSWQPTIDVASGKTVGVQLTADQGGPCSAAVGSTGSLIVNFQCYIDDEYSVKAAKHPAGLDFIASISTSGCDGTYQVSTCLACPDGCSGGGGGLGGGTIFFIIVLVLASAYIGIGFAYNYRQGKTGMDAFPNIGMWRGLCGRCCGSGSETTSTGTGAKYEDFGRATYGTDSL